MTGRPLLSSLVLYAVALLSSWFCDFSNQVTYTQDPLKEPFSAWAASCRKHASEYLTATEQSFKLKKEVDYTVNTFRPE